jgi:hypothetical protein
MLHQLSTWGTFDVFAVDVVRFRVPNEQATIGFDKAYEGYGQQVLRNADIYVQEHVATSHKTASLQFAAVNLKPHILRYGNTQLPMASKGFAQLQCYFQSVLWNYCGKWSEVK